ncbi:hypothetical protein [Bacillus cereus group sp. TH152-1LC]|uniref:hypothetical protein n=1 Tax=Bacillus cereus group sp. TH152-1LC TaxID=3018060 RepID=UPI0022E113E1|nr:hypothetical protein [Bacillus cereus group sp. TH152-1LC]MDA1675608.1 hypothetical protein [Bacillus cereus group sp. TH152-1LC]
MKKIILSVLLFCLCFGLNLWSYQVFENSSLKVNFALNTLIITLIINLFCGYFYSVLLRIFTYKKLKTNMQILIVLNFCVFVSLNFWSIMIIGNLHLSDTLSIIVAVMIPIFYGYLHSIVFKNLIYTKLKGIKKIVALMILLIVAIISINFIFFRMYEFSFSMEDAFVDENYYICPDGIETMDLSSCK